MTEAITSGTVANQLAVAVPEFRPVIQDHVAFYDEVLDHVLFGDLTRFVEAAWQTGENELVDRCLSFLEAAITNGDDNVKNLVAVSFVENVAPWDRDKAEFIETWPAELQIQARRRGWKHGPHV